MTPEILFRICNNLALFSWLLLVFLGWKRWVPTILTGVGIPLTLALLYLTLLITHMHEVHGNFNTLAGVAGLFSNPWFLLAGWIHYLAFDLFIGSWQVRNAAQNNIPHWFVVPCLILTFLFGPVGLLLYFLVRLLLKRRFWLTEPEGEASRTY